VFAIGIVTRCPLELRLKKVNSGVKWKAVISYRKKRTESEDLQFVAGLYIFASLLGFLTCFYIIILLKL